MINRLLVFICWLVLFGGYAAHEAGRFDASFAGASLANRAVPLGWLLLVFVVAGFALNRGEARDDR